MSTNVRNMRQPASNDWAMLWLLLGAIGLWVLIWAALRAAPMIGGHDQAVSVNPVAMLKQILDGDVRFGAAEAIAVALALILVIGGVCFIMVRLRKSRTKKPGSSVRHSTRWLASRKDIESMSHRSAAAASKRMALELPEQSAPGVFLGRELGSGKPIWVDYETLTTHFWAARRGKTTTQVMPQIYHAPGGVITSSNKRDVVDDTLSLREQLGTCWVFDPQRIYTTEEPDWFFDPLDYIRRRPQDEWDTAANALASLFRDDAGMNSENSQKDVFSEGGQALVSGMLLAACLDNRPISDVMEWSSNERDPEPVEILQRHGWGSKAANVRARYELTDKTRSGVFANAVQMVQSLDPQMVRKWVTASAGKRRFDADEFIEQSQRGQRPTMYLLSKEGPTSASALTLILLVTLMDAAEEFGEKNRGGRLTTPLIVPLDEAANTVKWGQLSNKYSHYGSRSIIISTIMQSFTQGKRVWGEDSVKDMMTNSCVIYGGGIKDERFLTELSQIVGDHEEARVSRSHGDGAGSGSTSTQVSEKRTLSVSELQSLERGVALVIPQNAAPMLVRTVLVKDQKFSPEIRDLMATATGA